MIFDSLKYHIFTYIITRHVFLLRSLSKTLSTVAEFALAVKTGLISLNEAIQGLQVLKPLGKISSMISEVHVRESDRFNKQTVCCCNCSCSRNVIRAEFEGAKLDMTILESRFLNTPSLDEIKSEIKILKEKQSDLEVVINRQDDLICKLN